MSEVQNIFCPVPWVGLAVRTNGDFRVCCHANSSASQGLLSDGSGRTFNASTDSIQTIRNSNEIRDIRKSILDGEWHSACTRCKTDEASKLRSRRQNSIEEIRNSFTYEQAKEVTQDDGAINDQTVPLLDLDIRLGNKCNLKCLTCGPIDSSSWEKDQFVDKFFPLMKQQCQTMNWYENEEFWIELLSKSTNLKHLYLVGGEPLLIQRHFNFLKQLIEKGIAGEITLEYNTNLTILPDECVELWPHFRQVRVGVSIDAYKEVNDFIRYPSKFDKIEQNILKLKKISKVRIWTSTTISTYSVLSFIELAQWSHAILKDTITDPKLIVKSHALHAPEHLSLRALPKSAKNFIESTLREQIVELSNKPDISPLLLDHLKVTIEKYIHFMNTSGLSNSMSHFISFTNHYNLQSNYKFEVFFPELSKLIHESV